MAKDNDKTPKQESNEGVKPSNKGKKGNPARQGSQSMVVQSSKKAKESEKSQSLSDEELLAAIRPQSGSNKSSSRSTAKEEQVMSPEHSDDSNDNKASQGSTFPLSSLFGLGALILAVIIGIWNFSQGSHVSDLENQIEALKGQSAEVDESLNQWQIVQSELQAESKASMDSLTEQMTGQMDRMNQLGARQDWKLHEARYLVVLAYERLQAFDDVQTAKALLEGADQRVKSMLEPGTRAVREALAKDITAIESANALDVEGLWASLGGLAKQIESLEFLSLTAPENRSSQPEQQDEAVADEQGPAWKQALSKSWEEVKGLVKVREFKTEQLDNLLTSPQQEQLLYAMKLLIEEARWAVLYRNQEIYNQSLKALDTQLQEYFVQDTTYKNVQFKIEQLLQKSLTVDWPKMTNSIQAIEALMATKGISTPKALKSPSPEPLSIEADIPSQESLNINIEVEPAQGSSEDLPAATTLPSEEDALEDEASVNEEDSL